MPKLLVVLDLNGTILESAHARKTTIIHDARARAKYVYFRPGMHDFLTWLFTQSDAIDVGVWTSNITENALAILDVALLPSQRRQLRLVYTRSQCTLGPNYASYKHVSRLWDAGFSETHTIIVDDSADKIVPPTTPAWYRIPTFTPSSSAANDTALLELRRIIEARLITSEKDS